MRKFELNEIETKAAEKFKAAHYFVCYKKKESDCTCDGGFEYIFSPNEIGTGISIRCSKCRQEGDITDYDCW